MVRLVFEGPTRARELKMWANVGKVEFESMLNPRTIRDPRGGGESVLILWIWYIWIERGLEAPDVILFALGLRLICRV